MVSGLRRDQRLLSVAIILGMSPQKEWKMAGVRLLVGTRKGAFVMTSDEKREMWEVSAPFFAGWRFLI